ncbi:MAG TPA: NB-ARC domain-containing protein, partial [Aggregatilineales bacterium]|nr:NB-ARC domain-containing protein [Aggregatilineales bacterium]
LLSDTTDRQVALTALRGLRGIGKSVMANVVCRDEFVSGAFPDGVFWVELGREPQDITGKIAIVGQGLGDETGQYALLDNAISSLRNILKHKSALIVLDDVWAESLKVAQYFIGTSPRTRWL